MVGSEHEAVDLRVIQEHSGIAAACDRPRIQLSVTSVCTVNI